MTSLYDVSVAGTYHEWEDDGDALDRLDGPQRGQTGHLDGGEDVAAVQRHVTQVDVVGLVLGRHEDDQHTLHQLCVVEESREKAERLHYTAGHFYDREWLRAEYSMLTMEVFFLYDSCITALLCEQRQVY